MPTQLGTVGVFDHYPGGFMWTGSGPREVVKYVSFPAPFSGTPKVAASVASVDSSNAANLRISVNVQDVTDHGFYVRVLTCADTRLASAAISWIATK